MTYISDLKKKQNFYKKHSWKYLLAGILGFFAIWTIPIQVQASYSLIHGFALVSISLSIISALFINHAETNISNEIETYNKGRKARRIICLKTNLH